VDADLGWPSSDLAIAERSGGPPKWASELLLSLG
jgi:hypothetical protein